MEWLQTIFNRFTEAFKWFWILQPWEQALRVRGGKTVKKFNGGVHFKIPYYDFIFSQNCRLRIADVPSQEITTLDGKTITISGALKYRVEDVTPLYMKLHTANDTIGITVQGILTEKIAWSDYKDCEPDKIMQHVNETMAFDEWGLADYKFILTHFAVVKTYRFITGDLKQFYDNALRTDGADRG